MIPSDVSSPTPYFLYIIGGFRPGQVVYNFSGRFSSTSRKSTRVEGKATRGGETIAFRQHAYRCSPLIHFVQDEKRGNTRNQWRKTDWDWHMKRCWDGRWMECRGKGGGCLGSGTGEVWGKMELGCLTSRPNQRLRRCPDQRRRRGRGWGGRWELWDAVETPGVNIVILSLILQTICPYFLFQKSIPGTRKWWEGRNCLLLLFPPVDSGGGPGEYFNQEGLAS